MLARVAILLIRLYQLTISRVLGNVCRFEPSCSRYAVACLEEHGFLRGGLLSFGRLCKCHPFHPGGHDPPPARSRAEGVHDSRPARTGRIGAAELTRVAWRPENRTS